MATHKSALKKHRQSVRARARNRQQRTRMRSRVRALRGAIDSGDLDAARGMLQETLSILDHSAKLGVVPDNTVARTKSRLTRAVNKIATGS